MVYLYYCPACDKGKHDECERTTPCANGEFGGRRCTCACNGDPLWNGATTIKEKCLKLVEQIHRADELTKNSNVIVGKPKKFYGKDLFSKRPSDENI